MKIRKVFKMRAAFGLFAMLLLALGPTSVSGTGIHGSGPVLAWFVNSLAYNLVPGTTATDIPAATSGWQIITIPGETSQGTYSSIALDQAGNPHISFMDATNRTVKYTHLVGSSWEADTIDTLEFLTSESTSLGLNGADQPQVAYNYNNPVRVGHAEWDGSQWQGTKIAVNGGISYTDMALKATGEPCISYAVDRPGVPPTYTPIRNIEVVCRTAGSWPGSVSIYAKDVNYSSSRFPMYRFHSLALDSQDRPHFSFTRYTGSDNDLRYRSHTTDIYGALVDGEPDVGFYSSIALDDEDHPHISYYDLANGDLKYAMWDGSAWIVETVDSADNVGRYTALALDGSDKPHISYYDVTNNDLKYAFWDGSQWQIETVDSSGSVGQYTSLALDTAGNAHISYYDATNLKLKYATNSFIEQMIFLPLVLR